ncbi:hypothetical protein EQG68_10235 [Flavobacterium piscinae]|uniref:Uncharacterized protein n=1 Tax=Flavobacterium piscinae TaxID=2506424 RepID=A0A4Q1KNX3_9FLAO|nr:hypothetical protein [Flavobacterium piscinae]RXR31255.1 hypothetical protein EQG68_10235 [Flavobacterium piscinae]
MILLFKRSIFPFLLLSTGLVGLYLLSFTNWFQIHKIWILEDFQLYIIFSAWLISSCYYFYEVQKKTLFEQSFVIIPSETVIEEKDERIKLLINEFNFDKFEDEYGIIYSRESMNGSRQNLVIDFNESEYIIYVNLNWLDYLAGRDILKQFEKRLK